VTKLCSRSFHSSSVSRAQITVNVPSMGDSITEGTIVEWCFPSGSRVREGDVLALVETDKVTVDIKADREGVLAKKLGEVDDSVEVGRPLYILDTDVSVADSFTPEAVAKVNDSLDAVKAGDGKSGDAPAEPDGVALAEPGGRAPSIRFLGKEGWRARLAATGPEAPSTPVAAAIRTDRPQSPTSVTRVPYNPMHGRPVITDEEMEALVLGGAEEAPEVEVAIGSVLFRGGKHCTAGPRYFWTAG